jgi:predicted  nucleic acid-binding Zn-ribbon protein
MEKNYDELLADIVIKMVELESQIKDGQQFMDKLNKRMDLTIKRMVKAESRLEDSESRMKTFNRRTEAFDKKLEQSIKDQKEFSKMQSRMNKYFLATLEKLTNRNNGNGRK